MADDGNELNSLKSDLFERPFHGTKKTPAKPDEADRNLTGRQMVREASQVVRDHISRQPHVQRLFSFMPTLMTRVSPFHFKNRNIFKQWPLVRLDSGEGISWGKMVVVGELLIIFDETILFSLLALMKKYRSDSFQTSETELCDLSELKTSKTNHTAIWRSIQRLAGTRIDLDLFKGTGKKQKLVKGMTGTILSYCDRDPEVGEIRVAINPYFLEMFGRSFVTNIDMRFRSGLKSDVSKAFYRFYQGQIDLESDISILKLARAVNLDVDEDFKKLKRKVREGLKELSEKGYLKSFEITKENRVQIAKDQHDPLINDGTYLL